MQILGIPLVDTSTDLLFAYGTLMRGLPLHLLLERRAEWLGTGSIRGRLVDLGGYPGALPDGTGTMRGELYRLQSPELLAVLDSAEGPEFPRLSTHGRVGRLSGMPPAQVLKCVDMRVNKTRRDKGICCINDFCVQKRIHIFPLYGVSFADLHNDAVPNNSGAVSDDPPALVEGEEKIGVAKDKCAAAVMHVANYLQ